MYTDDTQADEREYILFGKFDTKSLHPAYTTVQQCSMMTAARKSEEPYISDFFIILCHLYRMHDHHCVCRFFQ